MKRASNEVIMINALTHNLGTEQDSLKLYKYLCEHVVGSEKVVHYRRILYKISDEVQKFDIGRNMYFIAKSSGSLAEGLDLPGSDYDVMILSSMYQVFEKYTDIKLCKRMNAFQPKTALIMETAHAQPGFALLRIHEGCTSQVDHYCINTESGRFLSSKLYRQNLASFGHFLGHDNFKINGPCITDQFNTRDTAVTLRCETWPHVAMPWATRSRMSQWPSNNLVSRICKQGVLFVPIGSKSDSENDNPLEWRMSFSAAEKVLIHSWNHTQFLCYALLKIMLKDVIQKCKAINKTICSYFLKTTMLWLLEELDPSVWTPQNLLRCFFVCIDRLIYLNECNYIPNYFIVEHNMIDRKILGQSRNELVTMLKTLRTEGWTCFQRCETLQKFKYLCYMYPATYISDCENTLFKNLSKIVLSSAMDIATTIDDCIRQSYSVAQNNKYSNKTRSGHLYFLAQISTNIAKKTFNHFWKPNKSCYFSHRKWLAYALIGVHSDMFLGWLLIAVYFYTYNQYSESLGILEYAMMSLSVRQYIKQHNFTQTTLFRCMRVMTMLPFCLDHVLDGVDLDIFQQNYILCPPVLFCRFLQFACHYKIGDLSLCQQSLQYMIMTVENNFYIRDLLQKCVGCLYISHAFRLIGDLQNAKRWTSCAILLHKST